MQHVILQEILDKTKVGKGKVSAFVELHIEQGPLLEREGVDIGVVTAIAAPAAFRLQFNGGGGHAGALLMPDRFQCCHPAMMHCCTHCDKRCQAIFGSVIV